ncbi:MAG TPA: DUF3168 domain-containing protein [Tepidisphaeraceae bacterium]|jgi:hypothetical protein|nr:DUF3168 domain-containing protein [Tepidisphaeraceae bacterium]
MDVETAIVAHLRAVPLIESLSGGRVVPAGSSSVLRPNIVYQRLTTKREYSNDGPTHAPWATVQIGCWADTLSVARQLSDAVIAALDGFTGEVNGFQIDAVFITDENSAPESAAPGKEEGIKGILVDCVVHYQE